MALVDGYRGVVLDIDGVLVRGRDAIPGAADTLAALRACDVPTVLCTNNASRTPASIAERLAGVGLQVDPQRIVTSAIAAAALLAPGDRCLPVGGQGLRSALTERGCVLVDDPTDAEVVVVGFTRELSWEDLRRATLALRAGARFLGTNGDVTFPSHEGLLPGNGAALAALVATSGREPEIAGKPMPALFEQAARLLPDGPLLMVGDRPETDIAGAAALGWDTALVLTGVTASADGVRPAPTHVLASVGELVAGGVVPAGTRDRPTRG